MTTADRRRRTGVTALLVIGAVTLAVVVGIGVLLATAAVTGRPVLFVGAGVFAFLVADAVGAGSVARRARPARRRAAGGWLFASSAGLLLAVFAGTALVPATAIGPPRPVLPGEQQVSLPTGSRLVVTRLPGRTPVTRPSIVVLHGGPGVPDLAANAAVLAPLTELGADVYLYAQLGTDASTRLADPRGYGRDRDVADLEALRARLGLDRMVLVGHSSGGALAAAYLAAHPQRVERLVLVSPGALDPGDTSGELATAGLDGGQRLRLYQEVLAPRALLGYALLQVRPAAAHAFLGDAEADARNDRVLALSVPALFCRPPADPPPVRGSGFYALQYPQSATAPVPSDPRPALTGLPTPTLIVKGGCDYLSWRSAIDYRTRLPRSQLLYLPEAGHNVHQELPAVFREAVRAFLDDRPVPGRVPPGADDVPAGYRGPR
ncbi:MAG TPA: alpha/beta hydrolase [Pseudonocardia sp.]|nr:alpha/beta hydrolase [Pseudonocardia sp.]